MQVLPDKLNDDEMPLQLLLFVDRRPSSREQIRQVRETLNELRSECPFELRVIDVVEQPYLAEHFRLIATPALVKIHPEPRQTLAGTSLVEQLQHWWTYWQRSVEDYLEAIAYSSPFESQPGDSAFPLQIVETEENWQEEGSAPEKQPHTAETNREKRAVQSIERSTELIQMADEIFQLKKEKEGLEHQLRFKDQIIAMLAHDLRNPLTAASIALETLEMGHDSNTGWSSRLTPALTAQLLKHARTQTRAIDRMITDILQAAKGANAELQINPQKLDLRDLCLDVLEDLKERFQAKSQHLKKDIPSDLPNVLADSERVRQVVVNLLDNAIKYTPVGGTISVSVLHRTTQKIQVSVCDNGPGIPEENRERIFEERYRLKRDETKEGYGIGLSLCQRIIRAHYGQIWVDAATNQGSCFHFTLPVFKI
jgi:two-component system clock-associated histidine kinase SasA